MYDILQLNDMLVPELLDIAEQLHITGAKKSDKQELIYKILDKQTVENKEGNANGIEKPRRKRTVKSASSANKETTAEVATETVEEDEDDKGVKDEIKSKRPVRKSKTKEEKTETEKDNTVAEPGAALLSLLANDEPVIFPDENATAFDDDEEEDDEDEVEEETEVRSRPQRTCTKIPQSPRPKFQHRI